MEKGEELLKCFSTHNKRRLLNILIRFPMTHTDLVTATKMKKEYVQRSLKEFVEAKFIVKNQVKHKFRIYSTWWYEIEFGSKDVPPARIIEMSNLHDAYNRELVSRGMEKMKTNISQKSLTRKRVNQNPLPDYSVNFIPEVFNLFKFNDPQFKRDIKYIEESQQKMMALSYFNS